MSFTRYFLTLLVWALILEIFVLLYYIATGDKPFEFYLDLVLLSLTLPSIGMVLYRLLKRRRKNGNGRD